MDITAPPAWKTDNEHNSLLDELDKQDKTIADLEDQLCKSSRTRVAELQKENEKLSASRERFHQEVLTLRKVVKEFKADK